MRRLICVFAIVCLAVVDGFILPAAAMADEVRTSRRDALRQIVQEQCVPNYLKQFGPGPCERVVLTSATDPSQGFAILADRKGGAHFLLIPTRTIAGIESPDLVEPMAINYFAAAWKARDVLQTKTGYPLPRRAIGLAVNSQHARGQDQLHIHIECLGKEIFDVLQASIDRIGDTWSSIDIAGSPFIARRVAGEELAQQNPFVLLATYLMETKDIMGTYSLVVAGTDFSADSGFILLAGKEGPSGESLLDSTCAVAR